MFKNDIMDKYEEEIKKLYEELKNNLGYDIRKIQLKDNIIQINEYIDNNKYNIINNIINKYNNKKFKELDFGVTIYTFNGFIYPVIKKENKEVSVCYNKYGRSYIIRFKKEDINIFFYDLNNRRDRIRLEIYINKENIIKDRVNNIKMNNIVIDKFNEYNNNKEYDKIVMIANEMFNNIE